MSHLNLTLKRTSKAVAKKWERDVPARGCIA
jgi:hypothetical protein